MSSTDTMQRRSFLKKSALAGAATAGLSWSALAELSSAAAATPATSCQWGALSLRGPTQQSAIDQLERQIGRRLDTTHYRMPWTSSLNNKFTSWSAGTGHTQILSWFARTKTGPVSWKAIAGGKHDAWITTQARTLKATGWQGYFCFHKEPEDEGNSTDWKAAYNRVHRIFHNVGVRKFKWVVALMASTYGSGQASQWMPRHYDMLGVDGYNRYHCRGTPWRPFSQIFAPARGYAKAHNKRLYIIEAGCVEGEAGRKADWFKGARETMKRWPEVVGFSYNNENTDCTYYVDSSASSLAAFSAMGHDRGFR